VAALTVQGSSTEGFTYHIPITLLANEVVFTAFNHALMCFDMNCFRLVQFLQWFRWHGVGVVNGSMSLLQKSSKIAKIRGLIAQHDHDS